MPTGIFDHLLNEFETWCTHLFNDEKLSPLTAVGYCRALICRLSISLYFTSARYLLSSSSMRAMNRCYMYICCMCMPLWACVRFRLTRPPVFIVGFFFWLTWFVASVMKFFFCRWERIVWNQENSNKTFYSPSYSQKFLRKTLISYNNKEFYSIFRIFIIALFNYITDKLSISSY